MTGPRPALRRRSVAVALGVACAAVFAAPATSSAALPGDDLPVASAIFRATHNSYSGDIGGSRGSIVSQLDSGVRFVEFDVHDNGYATNHGRTRSPTIRRRTIPRTPGT